MKSHSKLLLLRSMRTMYGIFESLICILKICLMFKVIKISVVKLFIFRIQTENLFIFLSICGSFVEAIQMDDIVGHRIFINKRAKHRKINKLFPISP